MSDITNNNAGNMNIPQKAAMVDESPEVANAQNSSLNLFKKMSAELGDVKENYQVYLERMTPEEKEKLKGNEALTGDYIFFKQLGETWHREFEEGIKKRNRCSMTEYLTKWIFLHQTFESSGYTDQEEFYAERARVSEEYRERFSPQHPVTIFDDNDPNKVLTVIPAIYRPLKCINNNDANVIDAFTKYATIDRSDIVKAVHTNMMQAVIDAQKVDAKELEQQQADNMAESIKVLELFNPEHPLVKRKHEMEAAGTINHNNNNNTTTASSATTDDSSKQSPDTANVSKTEIVNGEKVISLEVDDDCF